MLINRIPTVLPYFFIESAQIALYWSIAVAAVVLLIFGWFKTCEFV